MKRLFTLICMLICTLMASAGIGSSLAKLPRTIKRYQQPIVIGVARAAYTFPSTKHNVVPQYNYMLKRDSISQVSMTLQQRGDICMESSQKAYSNQENEEATAPVVVTSLKRADSGLSLTQVSLAILGLFAFCCLCLGIAIWRDVPIEQHKIHQFSQLSCKNDLILANGKGILVRPTYPFGCK